MTTENRNTDTENTFRIQTYTSWIKKYLSGILNSVDTRNTNNEFDHISYYKFSLQTLIGQLNHTNTNLDEMKTQWILALLTLEMIVDDLRDYAEDYDDLDDEHSSLFKALSMVQYVARKLSVLLDIEIVKLQ